MYNKIMKKRLCFWKNAKTKRGVASLYIVIFATILFGAVTLSFMRIILSESKQSSDDDLSRSAYDSAMAGVEDAKTAVNRYYQCLSGIGTGRCDDYAREALFSPNCDDGIGLAKYLYGYTDGEVKIQQNTVGGGDANNSSDQAYTCVTISDQVPDYRGTLSTDTRTKVVPLAVYDGAASTNNKISQIDRVSFRWYSNLNEGDGTFNLGNGSTLPSKSEATIPPTITLSLIRIGKDTTLNDLHTANNSSKYTFSTLLLTPASGSHSNSMSWNALVEAGNVSSSNEPVAVSCSTQGAFACSFELDHLNFSGTDSVFLVVSLPYADTVSDFAVTMYNGTEVIWLQGVQISVDSTGRTNDLVKRVETRLDPADLFFPYPQYALEMDGGNGDDILKKFWVTANCWHSDPSKNNGNPQACDNHKGI